MPADIRDEAHAKYGHGFISDLLSSEVQSVQEAARKALAAYGIVAFTTKPAIGKRGIRILGKLTYWKNFIIILSFFDLFVSSRWRRYPCCRNHGDFEGDWRSHWQKGRTNSSRLKGSFWFVVQIYEMFDMVAGVSTGAIISQFSAIRKLNMEQIQQKYRTLCTAIFSTKSKTDKATDSFVNNNKAWQKLVGIKSLFRVREIA